MYVLGHVDALSCTCFIHTLYTQMSYLFSETRILTKELHKITTSFFNAKFSSGFDWLDTGNPVWAGAGCTASPLLRKL